MTKTTFGEAIADARKALGLSQKEFASRVRKEDGTSITPQYLNDIEHDRRSPTTDQMVTALAKAVGKDVEYFFVLAGKLPPADIRKASTVSPERVQNAMLAFRKALGEKGKP